jgi:hypothetical protein
MAKVFDGTEAWTACNVSNAIGEIWASASKKPSTQAAMFHNRGHELKLPDAGAGA